MIIICFHGIMKDIGSKAEGREEEVHHKTEGLNDYLLFTSTS